MCNQHLAITILKEAFAFCELLFQHNLKDSYLYGSYARGDFDEESDVDILLTVSLTNDEIKAARHNIAQLSSRLSLKHDVTVSLTVKPHDQFEHYANILPFYQNVKKEGIRYDNRAS